ncbi:MAG: hypothetical protein JNM63_12345 [Spirochaetia bacterium]|nr:hypothetical protein [Spirochaetia bacterium]
MKAASLVFLLLLANVFAMPSYDDVLLVVKSGDANSLDVANYFKSARKIPDLNVVTLPISGSPASLASRDALASGISNYLDANGLTNKIRFIVLSYGFPQEAYDTGGVNVGLLDVFLTYRLARNEQAFATNNPYAFVRTENYNNRENIKFSR